MNGDSAISKSDEEIPVTSESALEGANGDTSAVLSRGEQDGGN